MMVLDPNWITAIATLLTAILALAIALFGDIYISYIRRPIIKMKIGVDEPHVIMDYSGRISTLAKLFRLEVINNGRTVAKNCRVKILSIYPVRGGYFERDLLKWSSAPLDMRYRVSQNNFFNTNQLKPIHKETKNISPNGGSEFCDLFYFGSRGHEVYFASSGERKFLAYDEDYIFTIEVTGDNIDPKIGNIKVSNLHKFLYIDLSWFTRTSQIESNYRPYISEEVQHPEQPRSESEDNSSFSS